MTYRFSLKEILAERGVKQRDLAARMSEIRGKKFNQPVLSKWASGARKPNVDDIIDLANALLIAPGDLFRLEK